MGDETEMFVDVPGGYLYCRTKACKVMRELFAERELEDYIIKPTVRIGRWAPPEVP